MGYGCLRVLEFDFVETKVKIEIREEKNKGEVWRFSRKFFTSGHHLLPPMSDGQRPQMKIDF